MADVLDARSVRWAEMANESTLGAFPVNPTMLSFPGDLTEFKIASKPEIDEYKYCKGYNDSNPLTSGKSIKTSETHTITVSYKPSSLTFLPYALCASSITSYTRGTTVLPISIGCKIGNVWCYLSGAVPEKLTIDFKDKKSTCEVVQSYLCMQKTPWSTDYIGTGIHASAPSLAPFTMFSLSSVLYDGVDPQTVGLILDSLKIEINNKITPVIDYGSPLPSKIKSWSFEERDIVITMGATLTNPTIQDAILGAAAHTLQFQLGGHTFTFSNVIWTNAPDVDVKPDNLIAMSLASSGPTTDLVIA